MNYGTFPALPDPTIRTSQVGTLSSGELEPDSVQASRRALMVGLGGLVIGSLGGALFLGRGDGGFASRSISSAGKSGVGDQPGQTLASNKDQNVVGAMSKGTMPAWASDMLSMDAATLVLMAGEFERRSARHREDHEAALGFERLLSVSLSSREREADMAAACAIRSLKRLGRTDLVAIWADDVRRRPELSEANGEVADILDRALRQRRRMIPR